MLFPIFISTFRKFVGFSTFVSFYLFHFIFYHVTTTTAKRIELTHILNIILFHIYDCSMKNVQQKQFIYKKSIHHQTNEQQKSDENLFADMRNEN